ncbi:YmaF family protein [Tissierella sp. MB52-C2]|uniref:YmaF family protein n=1 Tax=Tissierella sp. MB52-C2 TaxID=3070999 RepID=UPI00280C0FF7|nr:YmaF family protein [Tissierella sp. MB52-C2]WMM26348.1 YmaF family protein [Tissierella sp. MB52-C2]
MYYNDNYNNFRQTHIHEIIGNTKMTEECEDRHNHRFAAVSGMAISLPGGNHLHELFTNTDFFSKHYHHIEGISGPGIPVGEGKHIHFVSVRASVDDEHSHMFVFSSLIEDPLV